MLDNNLTLIILIGMILFIICNCKYNDNYERFSNNFNDDSTNVDVLPKVNNIQTQQVNNVIQTQQVKTNLDNVINNNILDGSDNSKQYNYINSEQTGLDNNLYILKPNVIEDKFKNVMPQDTRKSLVSKDLLPNSNSNDDWFQVPNDKFDLLEAVDLEIPEIKIGIDTVGQSRKNATYDIRAAPPNPKFVVSPWSNSTIEPDYNIKSLC
jgi:hypothetical protein